MSRDVHNLRQQRGLRRLLRKGATPAERALWQLIRKRQIEGRRFRRQYGVGPYILDFFCAEEGLAIELDGSGHRHPSQREYDQRRTTFLNAQDISVLRFENALVLGHPEFVIEALRRRFKNPPSTKATSRDGGE